MKKVTAKRLWDKGGAVSAAMHLLTVGDDPIIDRRLVFSDALGSAAHARMLAQRGFLKRAEVKKLITALKTIAERADRFSVPPELEDVHTAIEAELTRTCGEAGKRIHTARSRNDQIMLTVRLFIRRELLEGVTRLGALLERIEKGFKQYGALPMPGYTHMQPAMPSSVGMWLHALYEGVLDLLRSGKDLYGQLDSNPLGGGAGFGTSLPIDRAQVTALLGFSRTQRSPIDVNNSRGRYELRFLRWMAEVGGVFEKWSCDLMLFTSEEYRFFTLPSQFTTGSSIMPQKRNYDLVELLRSRGAKVRAAAFELEGIISKLPSSYHRDLQGTKAPLMRGLDEFHAVLTSAELILSNLKPNRKALEDRMVPELYATYLANREVKKGIPFRDAYRKVGAVLAEGTLQVGDLKKDFAVIQREAVRSMKEAVREGRAAQSWARGEYGRLSTIENRCLGR